MLAGTRLETAVKEHAKLVGRLACWRDRLVTLARCGKACLHVCIALCYCLILAEHRLRPSLSSQAACTRLCVSIGKSACHQYCGDATHPALCTIVPYFISLHLA